LEHAKDGDADHRCGDLPGSAIDEHRADDQHTFPITLFGRADEVIE
jgi:hypothetical protein